jgi:tetratricopeptide (TPR) repeat protein
MAPMIVLLFLRSPQTVRQDINQDTVTCPKCRALHAAGHTYCVNCGWELNRPYAEELPSLHEEVSTRPAEMENPVSAPAAVGPAHEASGVVVPAEPSPLSEELVPEESTPSEESPPEQPPVEQPVFRRPITPANFTERGLALFNQGKFQEAIDQFTKAIALDPKYLPAWARRAEAYGRLGRESKAEEDRRHLDGLRGQTAG